MASQKAAIHEIDFCGQIAAATYALISQNPEAYVPLHEARLEGFGTGTGRSKRKDLRFFDRYGKLVLCGEVKLPGTREGSSPYSEKLMQDAFAKAENANIQFFFTWNVNEFVLFDRSLWDRPLIERRVRPWRLGRTLADPEDVAREENLQFIKTRFLPDLLHNLADLISGRRVEWLPPDDVFIHSLQGHLNWPVQLMGSYLIEHTNKSKPFDLRIQQWLEGQDRTFVRTPQEEWIKAMDNMAKTLVYVWANRFIFYKALRARFSDLPRLELRRSIKTPEEAVTAFNRFFRRAVDRSGDYEPLLMPDAKDWATRLVFDPPTALDTWRGVLRNIESVDFREVASDVVGRIFQKLIGPDERHRYGQHFTGDDVVDLINGFCVRSGDDAVLDPACGSGSFLVRAYYRKRHLDPLRPHLDLISELFGCDIALYPAHLATLNLAAREINDEANYPRIARCNFFDVTPEKAFCEIPVPSESSDRTSVLLPELDAVVGNPPYVRQEKVEKKDKVRFAGMASEAWPDLRLSGRSDLHCYFWPAATRLLKPDGYFGFLTSSSWLDVEYGFALQGWVLRHFKVLTIMESAAEPWFEDARVKTCVTILQRCDDETERMENSIRFVRFSRRLADIIAIPPGKNEDARQASVEAMRYRILGTQTDHQDHDMRIIVKTQRDLWNDGVRAGLILGDVELEPLAEEYENGSGDQSEENTTTIPKPVKGSKENGDYHAGKWGRYLRAPDMYFEIMRRFGGRFVHLGEVATIRRGITSGCDAFFMPKDVTADVLAKHETDRLFPRYAGGAPRKEVEAGKLKIIEAGDGSIHPVEAKYLAPEVHSLMKLDRPIVHTGDLGRFVLLVRDPMDKLKTKSPWVWRYLRYGMTATFASEKSKGKPIPKRSTCAARDPWYDLTRLVKPGFALWPKAQQYRHIVPANPSATICNCNLYDVSSDDLTGTERTSLVAILNSTLVGLFKTFYGRFAGTEGNLKTEVVDVNLLEVPDPRGIPASLAQRLSDALDRMGEREVGRLVEEQLMDCHTPERARRIAAGQLVLSAELHQRDRQDLDDAVFELLGVTDPQERADLVGRLYEATARHFRDIRVVEIEKMQQRAKSNNQRFSVHDLAADIWDAGELEDATPLAEWVGQWSESAMLVDIPEERPAILSPSPMFDPNTVYFGKTRRTHVDCPSRGQAELVVRLANFGVSGKVKLPGDLDPCLKLLDRMEVRIDKAMARFAELAESRTGDERVRQQVLEALERWFVLGREEGKADTPPEDHDPASDDT
ncbi:MAG TPA: N-6 DNA methylase [Sedimentisphaerales bacterium]|nr:N-6 DNA methylase [Sedimentisphaerales bacterium]HNU27667.1 N-6 DNA methylase [Sedimentisphaerales bacterium]